jgi:hypothetical protein
MEHTADASPGRAASTSGQDGQEAVAPAIGVPPARLHVLRAGYLLVAIGLVVTRWPLLADPQPWPTMEGVVTCMLVAVSLLAFVGVRHPLRMLPLLLFESAWKLIWLAVVAVPLWLTGRMDDATWDTASACLWVGVVLFVIPWRYVWVQYVTDPGDRWRCTTRGVGQPLTRL